MSLLVSLFVFISISALDAFTVTANNIREVKVLLPHSYEVSIQFVNRHFCTGAIISPRHVLTAAHCFYQNGKKYPDPMFRYMSVVSGSNAKLSEGGHSHKIKNVTTQQELHSETKDFWISDIAVITLETDIMYTALEQPIDLPDRDVNETVRSKMSTWNSPTETLQVVEVVLISHKKCAERLKEKYLGEHDSKICGFTRTGRGFCLNNDGGPLVQNGKVVGIASASRGCINGSPDVYTNVYKNLDFINMAMLQNYV